MTLDITSLVNAITRLEEGLIRYQSDITDTQIREGLIQRFEFTYELAHKIIKRFLESVSPTPGEYDTADFQYLIRSASEQGLLLNDWAAWKGYRYLRSKTSQTYDEDTALEVVASIPPFLDEVRYLRDQLQRRLAG
jgi:nucleotidyltransferase substrate binding protein (TIGR01987 family)